ncbi:MAG: DUF1175 family protein [Proteobacteria bacterium]|nr:DUF1175 family protein [Pseudomonadota bacterium]
MARFIKIIVFCALMWTTGSGRLFANTAALSYDQSLLFRNWFTRIVKEQMVRGPDPRWTHLDCAGLVRFATYEALRPHTNEWFRVTGFNRHDFPQDFSDTFNDVQRRSVNRWNLVGAEKQEGHYVSALGLIQGSTSFVSKNVNLGRTGDLLFFDQGDSQHIMIHMGSYVAYHTGTVTKQDNGLRVVAMAKLMNWKDTRWRPQEDNPNFIGIYRFSFLAY